jgi:probable HAF family extracellular repeat protein
VVLKGACHEIPPNFGQSLYPRRTAYLLFCLDGLCSGCPGRFPRFFTIDFPGSTFTQANGISNSGKIVGSYGTAAGDLNGFLDVGGVFTALDVPGSSLTYAYGINSSGSIVGYYDISPSQPSGFLYSGFSTIDVPGASQTWAYGINGSGSIVGYYEAPAGDQHGFLYAGGDFTTIDVPGATGDYSYTERQTS